MQESRDCLAVNSAYSQTQESAHLSRASVRRRHGAEDNAVM